MRDTIIDSFPATPRTTINVEQYLQHVEETFFSDAYNSLLIEGDQVDEGSIIELSQFIGSLVIDTVK